MEALTEIRPGRRIKLSIYKTNPEFPTIFMIHGMGGRGYQWREQVEHLKDRYNLIVPDLLGQGESEKPEPKHTNLYSFSELAKDLQVLFETHKGAQNYLCGHSYGGPLAVALARANAQKIQKLVLITPVSCQPFETTPFAYSLPVPVLELLRSYLDKSFEKLAFAPRDNPSLLKEEKAGRDLNRMYVIKALLQGMRAIPFIAPREVTQPSLVLSGHLDGVIPAAAVKAFYSALPQHTLYELADAAHMVHLEKNKEVNQLLDEFLA
jgi:pimeloyl-ACP methyl ester carboxylesterase